MRYRIEKIGIHILAFFVARCRTFGMYPFVVPFFMASYIRERSSLGVFVMLMLGVASRFDLTAAFRYAIVIIFLVTLLKHTDRRKVFADNNQMALAAGMVLFAVSMPYQYVVTRKDNSILYSLLEGIIAACFTLVFERAMTFAAAYIKRHAAPYARGQGPSQNLLVQEATKGRIEKFGQAFIAMEKMLSVNEEERKTSLPNGLSNMYLSGDGISLLNAVESQSNRLSDMRMNFIKQLGRIGGIITSFQSELIEQSLKTDFFEDRVEESLGKIGVNVTKAVLMRGKNERLEVYVSCMLLSDTIVTGARMAVVIGKILGTPMVCIGKGENIVGNHEEIFIFAEKGKYMLTTGVVRKNRTGEKLCGDNFSITKLDTQKAMLMISDGMGFGESANVKSEQIVELLEQLLSAGFCTDLTIELLNSVISFLTGGNISSTIDLLMIDFYTGDADFVKLGASATFIKRGDRVECIRSTSLPVGILEQIEFDTCERKLYHGDMVVMVSDGILDGIVFENKETYLATLIAETDTNNVQMMAETILKNVEEMRRGVMRDDSTVLVAGLWERRG